MAEPITKAAEAFQEECTTQVNLPIHRSRKLDHAEIWVVNGMRYLSYFISSLLISIFIVRVDWMWENIVKLMVLTSFR